MQKTINQASLASQPQKIDTQITKRNALRQTIVTGHRAA